MKEKFNIGVEGGAGVGGGKGGKGGGGMLGNILKALAPLAILLSLKPIQQILELTLNILTFALLKILKFLGIFDLGELGKTFKENGEIIKTTLDAGKDVSEKISEKLNNLKGSEQLNELINMEKILETNGIKIADGIVANADTIRGILEKNAIDTEKFSDDFLQALDKGTVDIQEVQKQVGDGIKNGIEGVDFSIKSVKDQVQVNSNVLEDLKEKVNTTNALLGFLEKIHSFFQILIDKISGLFGFGGRGKSNPDDTINTSPSSGGAGGNKTIIMQGVQPQELIDVVRREFAVEVNESSRF